MPREIHVLWAGRHERRTWEVLCARYRERIARDVDLRERLVKVKAAGDDRKRRVAEGRELLAALPEPCWTIALDVSGRQMSSQAFAAELARLEATWPHPIAFVLGSDLGLSPDVLAASRLVLSFGPMTFGHELARLMLYEQIYRATSLRRGINYHRQPL